MITYYMQITVPCVNIQHHECELVSQEGYDQIKAGLVAYVVWFDE